MSAPNDTDDHALLVQFLHDRDVECPVCKYNLRMLTSPRCPECGRDLKLTVGTLEPFMRAWIVLCVTVWAGAGIGLLFLAAVVTEGFPPGRERFADISICYFIGCIPIGILVTIWRQKLLRWDHGIQWILAVLVMMVTAIMFGLFIYIVAV